MIFFKKRPAWHQVPWFAIDCETTGLNPKTDKLLSISWVPIQPPFVALGQAVYELINQQAELHQSSTIHQLTPEMLAAGKSQAEVLKRLANETKNAYFVAHYAPIEKAFLDAAMQQENIVWAPLGWYDTLFAAKQKKALISGRTEHLYTLSHLRQEYGLPPFEAHHARSDAIACAELFLAQIYQRRGKKDPTIQRVLHWGGGLFK